MVNHFLVHGSLFKRNPNLLGSNLWELIWNGTLSSGKRLLPSCNQDFQTHGAKSCRDRKWSDENVQNAICMNWERGHRAVVMRSGLPSHAASLCFLVPILYAQLLFYDRVYLAWCFAYTKRTQFMMGVSGYINGPFQAQAIHFVMIWKSYI
jgi:hypothetical protein